MSALTRSGTLARAVRTLPVQTRSFTLASSAGTLTPSLWAGIQSYGESLRQRVGQFLEEAILRAVPKKHTTHSRRRMRDSNKAIKDRKDINKCPACGRNKLMHHLCLYCYGDIKTKFQQFKKDTGLL
ncbi:hypothetical protein IWQ60_005497 [Tieghemiomyces parasiticus]|uniref:Large ribosomal subunit protein bL32m n=1 Tax=Tieghemiomyces parasiticus TaxID=78921 RepID=A0A9W8DUK3_9FUNG|nr:hypothetical protein IWQ60_005497 [Tieghemiomyces parasiticus]